MTSNRYPDERQASVDLVASTIGPYAACLANDIWDHAVHVASRDCTTLLRYARRYHPLRIEAAIHRMFKHKIHTLDTLSFVLVYDLDKSVLGENTDLNGQLRFPFAR